MGGSPERESRPRWPPPRPVRKAPLIYRGGGDRRSQARDCDDLSVDEDRDGPPHMLGCRLAHLPCTGRGELHADPELGRAVAGHHAALRDVAVRHHRPRDAGTQPGRSRRSGPRPARRQGPSSASRTSNRICAWTTMLSVPDSRAGNAPDDGPTAPRSTSRATPRRGQNAPGERAGAGREHGLLHSNAVPVAQRRFVTERIGVSQEVTRGFHRFLRTRVRVCGQGRGAPWPGATER